jgi:2-polyprenyl-6-methoxyphenol hydroxylase-like FAD-dependent oxidoreductase
MGEGAAACVIVGGGIGGSVLALALGRRGRRVVVLDRDPGPLAFKRPEVLARATIEAFDRLGVGTRIRQDAAIPLEHLELCQAGDGPLVQFTRDDFARAEAQPYSTDPRLTRQILLEAAEATGHIEVHRGVEVCTLVREGAGVTEVLAKREGRELTWRARLVIGDDGGRSKVREALRIPLRTRELPVEFLGAAGPALPGQPPRGGQAWINPHGLRSGIFGGVFMPLPQHQSAFALLLTPAARARFAAQDPARFYEAAARLSPLCKGLGRWHRFPEGFGRFRRPFGHAPRYVSDGVALLGDAVHPVTPAGGQGANMSVADALVLADVAGQALIAGDCSACRLAAYEARRRAANHRALRFSVRANRILRAVAALPWAAPFLLGSLRRMNRSPSLTARVLRAVSHAVTQPVA